MVTHPKTAKGHWKKKSKKSKKKRTEASESPSRSVPSTSFEREAKRKQVRYREDSNSLSPPPELEPASSRPSPPKQRRTESKSPERPIRERSEKEKDKEKEKKPTARRAKDSRYVSTKQLHERLPPIVERLGKFNETLEALQNFVDRHGYVYGNASDRSLATKLYSDAKRTGDAHVEHLRKILHEIDYMRKCDLGELMSCCDNRQDLMYILKQQAHALPLYVGGVTGDPGPYVGALPVPDTVPLKAGDYVAALYEETWILGEVGRLLGNGRYEILDVDQEHRDREVRPKVTAYVLRKLIVPLPKYRADPRREPHALFPNDAVVLALYPQTTCFYKGVICKSPTSVWEDYEVMFEDNGYPTGFSPPLQRYVVTFKDVVDTEYVKKMQKQEKRSKYNRSDDRREVKEELASDKGNESDATESSCEGARLPVITVHARRLNQHIQ